MRLYIPAHLVALSLLGTGAAASAQSLADVAKKEEERRKTVAEPGKVYTNQDLGSLPPATASPALPAPAAGASASQSSAKPDPAKPDQAKPEQGKTGEKPVEKDQAYWSGRMKELQAQLSRDQTFADALQTRINSLSADFVNRDDPAQRTAISADRDRAAKELDALKKAIEQDKKAIADLEEEARRANVPAGWLR